MRNNFFLPKVVGGLGEMKSNGGSQYYQQCRVYDSKHLALALPANLPGGSYRYLVEIEDEEYERILCSNLQEN